MIKRGENISIKTTEYHQTKEETLQEITDIIAIARFITVCGYGKTKFTCSQIFKRKEKGDNNNDI